MSVNTESSASGIWTNENEKLLKEWAEKAKSYRWLHHKSSNRYSHRSQILTILISILSYISGGSVLTSNFQDAWFKYLIGYLAILGGILTNINGLVGWKQLAEKHKVLSTQFSSFERSISSMLSINESQRANAIEFINMKRKELDEMISIAPNIPTSIIRRYEKFQDKEELSHFWIVFYTMFCCNKNLRNKLLGEEESKMYENPSYNPVVKPSIAYPRQNNKVLTRAMSVATISSKV